VVQASLEIPRYWAIALAVLEKAILELEPIRRMVPTTRTRITKDQDHRKHDSIFGDILTFIV